MLKLLRRYSAQKYLVSVLKIVGGMLVGALAALAFHSSPFAGEATGGICALGFVALETYETGHGRR